MNTATQVDQQLVNSVLEAVTSWRETYDLAQYCLEATGDTRSARFERLADVAIKGYKKACLCETGEIPLIGTENRRAIALALQDYYENP